MHNADPGATAREEPPRDATSRPPVSRGAIVEALRQVLDPELGINIVDLGLIYDVNLQGGAVRIAMATTSPLCPAAGFLARMAIDAIRQRCPELQHVEVIQAREPEWSPAMMSPRVARELGWTR